jgi:RNA recognition motif-containing protein
MSNSSDDSSEEDERPEPDTTLFIKNLNFNTNEEDIKEVSIEFMMLLLEVLK